MSGRAIPFGTLAIPTLAWLAMLGPACSNANSSGGGLTGSAGAPAQDASADHAAGGAGGNPTTGSGGSTGAGGAASGTGGAAGSAGTDASAGDGGLAGDGGIPLPPCAVAIKPVSFGDLIELPAGPNVRLRVRGVITGTPPPAPPLWIWTVTIVRNSEPVAVTPDPDDPSVIEFPLTREESYLIEVTVSDAPACGGQEVATATFTPSAAYHVRITPPRTRPELPPYEETLKVGAGQPLARSFYFDRGARVSIDPKTAASTSVRSYVRISSPGSSWAREGDTTFAPFVTSLADGAAALYDLLVVPLCIDDTSSCGSAGNVTPFAPLLFTGRSAARIGALSVVVDAGLPVTGGVRAGGGALAGATVVLRAGALPSTLATSDAGGRFALLARPGRFSALVLPPDGSALPEAHLDATADAAVELPAAPAPAATLDFAWGGFATTSLSARFLSGGGAPAAGLDVRLDSDAGALPAVGTFTASGVVGGTRAFTATGAVHRRASTDAAGSVSFAGLPRGTYRLMALPPVTSSDGLTVAALDLGSDLPVQTVTLAAKVSVSGRLTNAPSGTRLLVLDDQPIAARTFPAAGLGAAGAFSVRLDPLRSYHLVVDPTSDQRLSRVPLGRVQTGMTSLATGDRLLPGMLPFTGQLHTSDGQTTVAGALVQLFCVGDGPDCLDNSQLASKDPLPLIEGVTDATGSFALWIPDPAPP